MGGSLSPPLGSKSVGKVACRPSTGAPPPFFIAFSAALLRCRSSSAIALLTVTLTILDKRLLTLRSQYPDRPPSRFGM